MTTTDRLTKAQRKNFDTLSLAADHDDLALVSVTLAEGIPAGTSIAAIVAVNTMGDQGYELVPLAMTIPGDPFELLVPPEGEGLS